MRRDQVISYPHMGSYATVFRRLFRRLFPSARILTPPPITRKTIELGSRHSPDFVCAPFKYNLGNYIEALEQGANTLFQTGTGCRYGYYGELQEQILRDLGYDFRFICLSRERASPPNALHVLREAGCELSPRQTAEAFLLAAWSIRIMDRFEYRMREKICFETKPGSFEEVRRQLLDDIGRVDSWSKLCAAAARCAKAEDQIGLADDPKEPIRVGIVGELYTLMEPFSNFNLEQQLAREGVSVSRAMGVWFLLFGRSDRRSLGEGGGYLRYPVGANGADSVAQSLTYAKRGYDGILHIKSFGCIPELNATPALLNLSREREIPILQMSFDSHNSETGTQTRLEAFADMLRMRKGENDGSLREFRGRHWVGVDQRGRT